MPVFLWQRRLSIAYVLMVFITYIIALFFRYPYLLDINLLPPALALLQVGVETIFVLVTGCISGLLLWRRGDERITMLIAVSIMALPNFLPFAALLGQVHPIFHIPLWILNAAGTAIGFWGLLSLPDGQIVYPRLRILAVFLVVWDTLRYGIFFINATPEIVRFRPLALLVNFIVLIVAFGALIRRYYRRATPSQRQQFKWYFLGVYVGGILLIVALPLRIVSQVLFGQADATLAGGLIASIMAASAILFYEAMITLSISRYGLWDVDLTLNRSVVTGLVTFAVLVLFVLGFGLTQAVLHAILPGDQSQTAVIIAAVLAGASFNPLRLRVRRFVDRRVYGLRFDLNQLERLQNTLPLHARGLHTGRMIEGYKLLDVIGRGGMGEVYKARKASGDTVAIKLLHEAEATDVISKQRLEREGMVKISHPNIVRVENYGEADGVLYVVMEYIAGKTLKEILRERGPLPLKDMMPLLLALADGIDAAHAQGYIHRDIKPSNIILSEVNGSPRAVLMDFGLAKLLHDTTTLTGSGAVGTIDYMAPEQIREARTVDYRADLYAFGIVVYELLTAHPPFSGGAGQILFSHLSQPPPPMRQSRPEIPISAELAVQRMLSKDPDLRFQTARAFVTGLQTEIEGGFMVATSAP